MTKEETDAIVALRETAECLLLTQQEMGRDIADMASAVTELTTTSENLVNGLHSVKLLELAVTQLGETVTAYTGKLGALFDEQRETSERLGRYLQDAAKQQSGIRQVEARLRVLEGGQVGER
jgi:hypothetical protein